MRLRSNELAGRLKQGLHPIYVVTGDEPLQMDEAADLIRSVARTKGFDDRTIIEADRRFDWNELNHEADSLSLFAQQRILDLRLPSGKPGTAGGKALVEYAGRPPQDTILLLTMPKLERSQGSSKWFKALDKAGAVIQIWPIEGKRLPPWIEQRMRNSGLIPEPGVVNMLSERIEGNLLAASQEIEKLLLLHGPGVISLKQLTAAVSDSARYDVFNLVDSALQGKTAYCVKIINGLRGEGTPAPVVLWALTREIRMLAELSYETGRGSSPQQAIAARREIWEKRRQLVRSGLQRLSSNTLRGLLILCGRTDRAIKGRESSDPWQLMQEITTRLAGKAIISRP
ncbi:MAG: DNA polymerase III subunit delta [Gammaproteobacteria bacterium]|nr:DNA polymerase III subunit delta [Gammaproteobacteria bacterium]